MKQNILLFVLLLCINSFADNNNESTFYYGSKGKINIILNPNKKVIHSIDDILTKKMLNADVKAISIGNNNFIIENTCYDKLKEELYSISNKFYTGNIYKLDDGYELYLFDEIIVKLKEENTNIDSIVDVYNLSLRKKTDYYQIYSVPNNTNTISIANKLYETGLFLLCYPNFFSHINLFSHYPNDPYFQYQVSLHNTGQLYNGHSGNIDADINAPEAWDITKGSSNIVIAVVDEGVTSNHADLPNSHQLRLSGSNFGFGDVDDPSPIGNSNHGNACAGVIAATMDNNEGIAGIAPNCKIMPIRVDDTTYPSQMADALYFAVNNGANIISCSWGYNTYSSDIYPVIVNAIQYAISHNVVVVFAAGNTANHVSYDMGYVTFPANCSSVITVGASDRYDCVANYSPINNLIDVVAPSHRAYPDQINGETLEMWTIDIPGDNGYNPVPIELSNMITFGEILPSNGTNYLDYTGHFGGTSHSCPVVAGVIALMLSVNPYLSVEEVYSILTTTSNKVGNYSYVDGRCDEMGYGRVDAFAAVKAAKTKYIQNKTYQDNEIAAEHAAEVIAGYSVTHEIPYGNVVVESGSNVKFRATKGIELNAGFEVKQGGIFETIINGI